jgi:hypothetical protein
VTSPRLHQQASGDQATILFQLCAAERMKRFRCGPRNVVSNLQGEGGAGRHAAA